MQRLGNRWYPALPSCVGAFASGSCFDFSALMSNAHIIPPVGLLLAHVATGSFNRRCPETTWRRWHTDRAMTLGMRCKFAFAEVALKARSQMSSTGRFPFSIAHVPIAMKCAHWHRVARPIPTCRVQGGAGDKRRHSGQRSLAIAARAGMPPPRLDAPVRRRNPPTRLAGCSA
jgi:hypothetical protein